MSNKLLSYWFFSWDVKSFLIHVLPIIHRGFFSNMACLHISRYLLNLSLWCFYSFNWIFCLFFCFSCPALDLSGSKGRPFFLFLFACTVIVYPCQGPGHLSEITPVTENTWTFLLLLLLFIYELMWTKCLFKSPLLSLRKATNCPSGTLLCTECFPDLRFSQEIRKLCLWGKKGILREN